MKELRNTEFDGFEKRERIKIENRKSDNIRRLTRRKLSPFIISAPISKGRTFYKGLFLKYHLRQ